MRCTTHLRVPENVGMIRVDPVPFPTALGKAGPPWHMTEVPVEAEMKA